MMMGYEGGDILLTGVAGQRSGRRPGLCVQAVGGGLVGRRLWFSDESALEAAWPPDHRPDSRPYGVRDECAIQIDSLYLYLYHFSRSYLSSMIVYWHRTAGSLSVCPKIISIIMSSFDWTKLTYYRAMHYGAKSALTIACRPSSVCMSVCYVGRSGSRWLEILETNCTSN